MVSSTRIASACGVGKPEHTLSSYLQDSWLIVASSDKRPDAATAHWSSIQTILEVADSDVLILQDCCAAAASSADGHSKGTTEIIAACGFEVSAPAVGEHSFTRALIEELRWSAQQRPGPVSIPLLHSKMLTRAKKSGNPRGAADGGSERRRTPIYIRVADRSNQRCIELAPLAQLPELVPNQEASSTTQFSTTYPESVQSSLEELFPDLDFVLPKVLVSIALREGETLL